MADQEVHPALRPAAAGSPQPQHTFWRGPNGIRAGWRVLIFLALVCVLVLVVSGALKILLHGQARVGIHVSGIAPLGLAFIEGPLLFFTAVPALVMARIERRKWGQYGLPMQSAFGKDFWIGIVVGFAAISASLLSIFALGGFRLTGTATHGQELIVSIASWSALFVLVGLAEEFSFRGYLQFTLTSGMGFWPSAILLSLLFGLAHAGNPGESKFGLFSVVLFGLLFCMFLRRRGNLWWAVGFHAGWDWGQTFFYGVPDSGQVPYHNLFNSEFSGPAWLTGGSVGPEASVFTPLVLGIVAILFARAYRENHYSTGS
jgi:membrane protease YdiL (CAAX protease family)